MPVSPAATLAKHVMPAATLAKHVMPSTTLEATLVNHAKHVMRVLGTGHSERVYHKSLATSLSRSNFGVRSEVVTPILFMGECVGFGRADLIVDNRLCVEIKANARRPAAASGQLKKYLDSLRGVERSECAGLVLNFNQSSGEVDFLAVPRAPRVSDKRSRFFESEKRPRD